MQKKNGIESEKSNGLFMKLSQTEFGIISLIGRKKNVEEIVNQTTIMRMTGISYPWVIFVVNKLEKMGYIKKEKNGRQCFLTLTELGNRVFVKLMELGKICNGE